MTSTRARTPAPLSETVLSALMGARHNRDGHVTGTRQTIGTLMKRGLVENPRYEYTGRRQSRAELTAAGHDEIARHLPAPRYGSDDVLPVGVTVLELADALANLDRVDGPRRWSYQEQAAFVRARLINTDPQVTAANRELVETVRRATIHAIGEALDALEGEHAGESDMPIERQAAYLVTYLDGEGYEVRDGENGMERALHAVAAEAAANGYFSSTEALAERLHHHLTDGATA